MIIIEGIYKNGKIELTETPKGITESRSKRQRLLMGLGGATVAYVIIVSLQISTSAAVLLPWFLPSVALRNYIRLAIMYQKKLDKAQALRQAMLKIMETHRNSPTDWGAFTLIGEAE